MTELLNSKCVYCGNNPVPHRITKYSESALISLKPFSDLIIKLGLVKFYFAISDFVESVVIFICRMLGVAKFKPGNLITNSRGKVLWEEAERRGIKMEVLVMLGKPVDVYKAYSPKIKKTIIFSGVPRPLKYITGALFWMDDKFALKEKFLEVGIPVAKGGSFKKFKAAQRAFKSLKKPVIIKPRSGSRGRHTTTFIYTEEQLKEAFRIAQQLCKWVVMEEHLVGSVYRGTVIGGKLVGFLAGDPPRVTGDGQHNIEQLIGLKNQVKHPKVSDIKISDGLKAFIARNGLTLQTVLEKDKTVDLSEKIGISYGGSNAELVDTVHPKMKVILEKAAKVVNDPILGFDLIIENPIQDPDTQKWGIIECNGVPFINLHHDPLHGQPKNVAQYVWDLFE